MASEKSEHTSSIRATQKKERGVKTIRQIFRISRRELGILVHNPIYWFCMVLFPLAVVFFFTSMMREGLPTELPIGVVDEDNSTTTRALIRRLDGFQTSHVVSHYPNINSARQAIQRNEIYGFMYFPEHTTENLLSGRQPYISFYYSNTTLAAGALIFRDMKTVSTLGSAAVGQSTMQAKGYTDQQIRAFLQPIAIDLHPLGNPWVSYNVYLSTYLIPACILLFIFLVTTYSIGTELKFNRSKEWISMAGGRGWVAIVGKFIPQHFIFLLVMLAYLFYIFGVEEFPHPGGWGVILLLALLSVAASEGFGIFIYGILPSLRLSMSVCALWSVLSFTVAGGAFPVTAMDAPIEALSYLFPMRHYYMIYQTSILGGHPLTDCWINITALVAFAALPLLVFRRIRIAMVEYEYIP